MGHVLCCTVMASLVAFVSVSVEWGILSAQQLRAARLCQGEANGWSEFASGGRCVLYGLVFIAALYERSLFRHGPGLFLGGYQQGWKSATSTGWGVTSRGGLPPAGHTQRNQANPTAGGRRQSLTSEIRLTPWAGQGNCSTIMQLCSAAGYCVFPPCPVTMVQQISVCLDVCGGLVWVRGWYEVCGRCHT
jgi:hypothetical protein